MEFEFGIAVAKGEDEEDDSSEEEEEEDEDENEDDAGKKEDAPDAVMKRLMMIRDYFYKTPFSRTAATLNRNSTQTLKIIRLLRFINRRFIRERQRDTERERERERTFERFDPLVSVVYISKVLNIRRERERFALSRLSGTNHPFPARAA